MNTSAPETLAPDLLIAWYGDDFTGAAAVMEVLAFAGVPSVLFLDVPTQAQLSRFPDLRAIGVASTARAQSPEWMSAHLPAAFDALRAMSPQLLHYKICSTLDSSPETGSIGRAIDIAHDMMAPKAVPLLVAAPQMRRYQMFGHLFAGLGSQVFRLDRHPVMARHPITPMVESDVARHISAQSDRIDATTWSLEEMADGTPPTLSGTIPVFTIDCADEASEALAGQQLWENRATQPFVVGSQGVEYALVRHWIASGDLPEQAPPNGVGRAHGMVSVSGSVSPTTAEQIAWSRANGFATLRFDVTQAVAGADALEREKDRVVRRALAALTEGADPLIFTAEGPDDPAVAQFRQAVAASQSDMVDANRLIGIALGEILHHVLSLGGIRRAVISGGDTSGYATQQLGIFAVSALAPTIPGASLLRAHAEGDMDGLQLALKGGQMGSPDYFGWIRDGAGARAPD